MMDAQPSQRPNGDQDPFSFLVASTVARGRSTPQILRLTSILALATFVITTWSLVSGRYGLVLFERPIQSSSLGLLGSAVALTSFYFVIQAISGSSPSVEGSIPLATSKELTGDKKALLKHAPWHPNHYRFFAVVFALVFRLELFKTVLKNIQCSWSGIEAVLPVLVALLENLSVEHIKAGARSINERRGQDLLRVLIAACTVAWGAVLAFRHGSTPRSTVICPAYGNTPTTVFSAQLLGVLLDAYVLFSFRRLLTGVASAGKASLRQAPLLAGALCLISAVGTIISSLFFAILPENRTFLSDLSTTYVNALTWTTCLFVLAVVSGIPIILPHSSTDIAVVVTAVPAFVYGQSGLANTSHVQFAASYIPWTSPSLLLLLGLALYYYITRYPAALSLDSRSRHFRTVLYLLVIGVFVSAVLFSGSGSIGSTHIDKHPVDALIHDADGYHSDWAGQATRSRSLQEAEEVYKARYNRHPPPGFDIWWKYATSKDSKVLDDFDTIEENLRPFWKLDPAHIRKRVKYLLSDTSNECAEVSIRDGKATVGQVIPTHRWMVDGIINMMKPFMQHLPDMDIAFNINDEPRVAVPYNTWESLEQIATVPEVLTSLTDGWNAARAKGWEHTDFSTEPSLEMKLFSFRNIWEQYGSIACPPNSPARTEHIWDASVSCTTCYEQHSVEVFLANWTLAGSPCHQPDLANMHGFYLSPSAFKATHELLPIFSQSRAGGFADILYPTAWNYNDKVRYLPTDENPDEDFDKKDNTLFWHGSATEGFSKTGSWRGQTRQRMVHLANNSTQQLPVLLPSPNGGWDYAMLATSEMLAHPSIAKHKLSTAIGFVDKYPRCDNGDCERQEANFGLFPITDFQHHWRHKFLLDADGAGFSGRFLPFLQSHSLPFKSAIFREWYDSRLTPWKHFVPIDIRLHGLWSTLVYFAGDFGGKSSAGSGATSGPERAKAIADEGRTWANRVLRKEDMEIYFYRLLLEYARVTDDDRASLGYTSTP